MIPKPLDEEIVQDDLEQLIEIERLEDYTIEYKSKWPGKADSGKADSGRVSLLESVCAFANTVDGDLIIGMKENNGAASELIGVDIENPDDKQNELDQVIRSGLEPTLFNYKIQMVPLNNGNYAVVIRVRKSFNGPHRVKKNSKFMTRGAGKKIEMPVDALRMEFSRWESVAQRVASFIAERIATIQTGKTTLPLFKGCGALVHIIPTFSFIGRKLCDFSQMTNDSLFNFKPIESGVNYTHNLSGIFFYNTQNNECVSYSQLFRNGIIEAYEPLQSGLENNEVYPNWIEKGLIRAFPRFTNGLKEIGYPPPYIVKLTLVGASGSRLGEYRGFGLRVSTITQTENVLSLPEIEIQEPGDADVDLKPIIDMLWNAFGVSGSPSYKDGRWKNLF